MSTPTEAVLIFSDGVERELAVEPGQSVLEAALAAEAPVLYQCSTGSCGTCLARLEAGQADHRAGITSSLLPSEREQGYRLLCLTEPKSNCRFSLAYDSAAGTGRPVEAKCFVNAVERIAGDVMRLELELAAVLPGQGAGHGEAHAVAGGLGGGGVEVCSQEAD